MIAASVWLNQDLTFMNRCFPKGFNPAAFLNTAAGFTDHAQAIIDCTPPQESRHHQQGV